MASSDKLVKQVQQSNSNPPTLLASSDDNALIMNMQATHGPGDLDIKVEPLLRLIKVIVDLSDAAPGEIRESDYEVKQLTNQNLGHMREDLANTINYISTEILGNYSGGQDVQETLLGVSRALSGFSWDAKGVIVLAAFAINYGEFCLVAQRYAVDPIAKTLAFLDQIPELEKAEFSRLKSNMKDLINALLVLIKRICEFKVLKSEEKNIKPDSPEILKAEALIPTAVYWTIGSILIFQSQIIKLTGIGKAYEPSDSDAWELSGLADKINQLHARLEGQLALCYQRAEENRIKELYQKIVDVFEATHDDNTEILKALLGSQDGALYNGKTKETVNANIMGKKILLLYISGLKLSNAELSVVERVYSSKEPDADYEIIWFPIVDRPSSWDEKNQRMFRATQDTLSWFSPNALPDPVVSEYIKNVWNFKKRSIIVTLNSKGKVVNSNAIYMMMIWGRKAFPFSSSREEQLWAAATWKLDLLVDGIVDSITKWIADGVLVCIYGGEDMEWIRKFTSTTKEVCRECQMPVEMVYMGTSNPNEKVLRINAVITAEKLSHSVVEIHQMWWFWFRLNFIWHSRVQRGTSPETDEIIREVFMMLTFGCSGRGWAIISKSVQMAKAMGDTMMECLQDFHKWKKEAEEKGLVTALSEQIHHIHTPKGCNRLVLPAITAGIPKRMFCFECKRMMERQTTFTCCGDEPCVL